MAINAGRSLAVIACVTAGLAAVGCGASSDSDDSTSGGSSNASTVSAEELGIPTEGEMVDTKKWKKDGPWTIGYADASQSNSWRVFAWQYMQKGADDIGRRDHPHERERLAAPSRSPTSRTCSTATSTA